MATSSIERALRPGRRELKKLLESKPPIHTNFADPRSAEEYLIQLDVFVNTLGAAHKRFFHWQQKLIDAECATESEQKQIDELIESDATLLVSMDECFQQYNVLLQRLTVARDQQLAQSTQQPAPGPQELQQPPRNTVKLPQIELRKFSGDLTQWQEFWDSFQSVVHSNNALHAVDKFNYLRGQLQGEARTTIAGLALTGDNYAQAVAILQDRFGDAQLIINSHYVAITNMPAAPDQTFQIRSMFDSLERHLRSLESLGEDIGHKQFVSMIFSKLPQDFIMRMEETKGDTAWTVPSLRQKVRQLLTAREIADQHHRGTKPHPTSSHDAPRQQRPPTFKSTTDALMTNVVSSNSDNFKRPAAELGRFKRSNQGPRNQLSNQGRRAQCSYCRGDHWSDECSTFKTLDARKRQIQGRCFNCLKEGHSQRDCTSNRPCFHCKRPKAHHSSLCPQRFPFKGNIREVTRAIMEAAAPQQEGTQAKGENALINLNGKGLLQTATAQVKTKFTPIKGGVPVRIMLDCGSQRSYITTATAKAIQAPLNKKETLSICTFGILEPQKIETYAVMIKIGLLDGTWLEIQANTIPAIGQIHHLILDIQQYGSLYATLPLADATQDSTDPHPQIDLLIGNDYYWDVVTKERIELATGLYLVGSKLGWVVSGRTNESHWDNKPAMMVATAASDGNAESLPYIEADGPLLNSVRLEEWWTLETMGIKDPPQDPDDMVALKNFKDTIIYDNKRYFVTWPWNSHADSLPTNFNLALGRLKSLLRRLQSDPDLAAKYDDIIQNQVKLGIIEPVAPGDMGSKKHYIPHHPVITPDKTTTKVRIVYDGSAKMNSNYPSINECLHRGPVSLDDVGALLIRFRLHPIALVADIEKAFLQVGLQTDDRDVTRFLWLRNPKQLELENNLQFYRFARVPFGIISSPFLLGATIQHHLALEGTPIAKQIDRDIYVDNLITGANSKEEAIKFYSTAKQLFQEASMNLREWGSNDSETDMAIPQEDRIGSDNVKVLGLSWNRNNDTLQLARAIPDQSTQDFTKRNVLRSIAKVFDPLGLFSPALVLPKLFLQELWTKNKEWDEPLNLEESCHWLEISENTNQITSILVPRYIGPPGTDESVQYELHCFVDASQRAYGACVYVRITKGSDTAVQLIFAKSRLAPTRSITLLRLELLAADTGRCLLNFAEKALPMPAIAKFIWSDSQCVLHWVKSIKPLKTFVANRVQKLRAMTKTEFRYIPTEQNPADILSRGCSTVDLAAHRIWWFGPPWLQLDQSTWPTWADQCSTNTSELAEVMNEEKYRSIFEASLLTTQGHDSPLPTPPFELDPAKYSKLGHLLRVTAMCFCFIQNLQLAVASKGTKKQTGAPTPWRSPNASELHLAQLRWVQYVQQIHFPDTIDAIQKQQRNQLQRELGLWLDDFGILRCGGRLTNAPLPERAIHPALLPKRDTFTSLVIQFFHERNLHCGVAHTLALIRQQFWIPGGRSETRRILQKCLICRWVQGGPYATPPMPALPATRVQMEPAFSCTRLDYLGPLLIKIGTDVSKVWICLFTCMSTRAIHLEVVEDLTAGQFLMALRRFISH